MNTPNKLTLVRVLMIPIFLVFALNLNITYNFFWALIIFIVASLTDLLDGYLARRDNLVTDFGKFMDPLADKLLVMSALIVFVEFRAVSAVVVVVILGREFVVSGLRQIAAGKGKILAADIWGKYKTVSQMVWICYLLFAMGLETAGVLSTFPFDTVNLIMTALVTFLTLYSGFNYIYTNRSVIDTMK